MNNFDNKYKERKPEETIQILKDFFKKRGFSLNITNKESEIGTWSCRVRLYYKDKFLQASNGKGLSYTFSLASGLAELYERFCNIGNYHNCYNFAEKYRQTNHALNGYYINSQEKLLPTETLWDFPYYKDYFPEISNKKELANSIFNKVIRNQYIGEPYKNILTDEVVYLDRRLDSLVGGSIGMATGNTFTEAFNQGFSEMCEFMETKNFVTRTTNDYYSINKYNITNPVLQNLIQKIESIGKELTILDCSYYNNLPVVAVIFIDKKMKRSGINFGAFPIFDIALERCLTEIYQNIGFYDDIFLDSAQVPYKSQPALLFSALNYFDNHTNYHYLNENLFNHIITFDNPSVVFIKDGDNNSIYEYYKNLIQEKKWDICVRDSSLSPNMSAIKISWINGTINPSTADMDHGVYDLNWDKVNYNFEIMNNLAQTITNDNYDFTEFYNQFLQINKIISFNELEYHYARQYFYSFSGPISITGEDLKTDRIANNLTDLIDGQNVVAHNLGFELEGLQKYKFLYNYITSNQYTPQEIIDIGKSFHLTFTEDDIKNYNNFTYLLEQIYYKPLWSYYHSKEYYDLIQAYFVEQK